MHSKIGAELRPKNAFRLRSQTALPKNMQSRIELENYVTKMNFQMQFPIAFLNCVPEFAS